MATSIRISIHCAIRCLFTSSCFAIWNALATAAIDYGVFAITFFFSSSLLGAVVAGRLVAGCFNFTIGKRLVFKSQGSFRRQVVSYVLLVSLLMGVSYRLIVSALLY